MFLVAEVSASRVYPRETRKETRPRNDLNAAWPRCRGCVRGTRGNLLRYVGLSLPSEYEERFLGRRSSRGRRRADGAWGWGCSSLGSARGGLGHGARNIKRGIKETPVTYATRKSSREKLHPSPSKAALCYISTTRRGVIASSTSSCLGWRCTGFSSCNSGLYSFDGCSVVRWIMRTHSWLLGFGIVCVGCVMVSDSLMIV